RSAVAEWSQVWRSPHLAQEWSACVGRTVPEWPAAWDLPPVGRGRTIARQIQDGPRHGCSAGLARQRSTSSGSLHASRRVLRTKSNLAVRRDIAFRTLLSAR